MTCLNHFKFWTWWGTGMWRARLKVGGLSMKGSICLKWQYKIPSAYENGFHFSECIRPLELYLAFPRAMARFIARSSSDYTFEGKIQRSKPFIPGFCASNRMRQHDFTNNIRNLQLGGGVFIYEPGCGHGFQDLVCYNPDNHCGTNGPVSIQWSVINLYEKVLFHFVPPRIHHGFIPHIHLSGYISAPTQEQVPWSGCQNGFGCQWNPFSYWWGATNGMVQQFFAKYSKALWCHSVWSFRNDIFCFWLKFVKPWFSTPITTLDFLLAKISHHFSLISDRCPLGRHTPTCPIGSRLRV